MKIIGDVHGKIYDYARVITECDESIQLGDFGLNEAHNWHLKHVDGTKHKILFGNHDYYPYLNADYSFGDYAYIEDKDIFLVRGADSIDKQFGADGLDWFSNEELPYSICTEILEKYVSIKPLTVISHDCPQSVAKSIFGITDKSITRQLLQIMLEAHKPNLWLFGHHHKSIEKIIDETTFKCLAELEVYELPD